MDPEVRALLMEVYECLPALSHGEVGSYGEYTPISGCVACFGEYDEHERDCPMVALRNKVAKVLGRV